MKIGFFSKNSYSSISKLVNFNSLTDEKFQKIRQKFINYYTNQGIDAATNYLASLIKKYGHDIVWQLAINNHNSRTSLETSETARLIHMNTDKRIGKDMVVIVAKLYNEKLLDDYSLSVCLPSLRNYCTVTNLTTNFPNQNKVIIKYVLNHFDSFAVAAIFDEQVEAFNYCKEWRELFLERFKKVYIKNYNWEYLTAQINAILKVFPELISDFYERNFMLIVNGKFQHDLIFNHSKCDSKAAILLDKMADLESTGKYHFGIVRSKRNLYNFFANIPYHAFTSIAYILENRFNMSPQTIVNNILKTLFQNKLDEILSDPKFDITNIHNFDIFITMLKFENLHVLLDEYIPKFLNKYGFEFFAYFSMYVGILPDVLKMQHYYCEFESLPISTFI